MNEYVCNLHVHSTYSDGTGTIEEIAAEARKAGVDVVGITDHHGLPGLQKGEEGWHGKTLVLIGTEIGHERNHYLAWRVYKEVEDRPENPQAVIDAVRAQGGIGFIAHPFEKGCKYGFSGKAFTWDNWNVAGFTGICIWNFTSQWKGPLTNPLKAAYYYFYRRGAVPGPDASTLSTWDSCLARGKVVGIGGTDAHAFRFGFWFIKPKIFPYGYLFKTINTHILTEKALTGELAADRKLVYGALERGHCFVSFDLIGDGRGFEFTAEAGARKVIMGDDISLSGGVKLVIKLPKAAHVRVIRDGAPWREGFGAFHMYTAKKPGVYRVEAFKRGFITGKLRGWIFSNPVYVRAW
jgi:hypothetical protein